MVSIRPVNYYTVATIYIAGIRLKFQLSVSGEKKYNIYEKYFYEEYTLLTADPQVPVLHNFVRSSISQISL